MNKRLPIKLLLIISSVLIAFVNSSNYKAAPIKNISPDSLVTISISGVGDLMCHSIESNYARVSADSFNFNPFFDSIKEFIKKPDFAFGNLETVTAGKSVGLSGYPLFNSPDEFISAIKYAGFKLISTANNHAFDQGEMGVLRTIRELKKNHLCYNGTFISQADRDSIRIFDIKGIKLAFLAYTYGINGNRIPSGKSYLINIIDTNLISQDIAKARMENADVIILHFHFGIEYKRMPVEYQKKIVEASIRDGADIIIGGHPHVIEPVDYFKTTNPNFDTGFVAYSLGNFISNQRWRYSDAGVILTLNITKNFSTNTVHISKVKFLSTWVFKGKTSSGEQYIILPSQLAFSHNVPKYLTRQDLFKMSQAFQDTKSILCKFTNKISPEKISGF
jgi:poly-gamma-glutamate capsule biosynthesis protein CapA/YwtB (metallophosphatase superfamily)